jgi:hypothetical protein
MKYCVSIDNLGLTLKPNGKWRGKLDETEFKIKGYSD